MIGSPKIWILLSFSLALMPALAAAQTPPDSAVLRVDTTLTLPPDAVPLDTSAVADTSQSTAAVDTTIGYSARSIEFLVGRRTMKLQGNAVITYKNMNLQAEKITVNWDSNLVIAEGISDTLWADTLREVIDTIMVTGSPVFVEGDQQIQGSKMTYNLKTRKGRVTEGTTAFADGFYYGSSMKKVAPEVLNAGGGSYTTCSLEPPHYSFRSKKMKLIVGDRVIAEPVVLYFENVPVFAIPFGIFPARHGRQSGLIIPTYGENTSQGRFLYHLGYYWAPNDYSDFQGTINYYERYGILFNGQARYNWRYHLSGSVGGAINNRSDQARSWELHINHDQTIDPDTRLTVHGDFVSSGGYYNQYGTNLNQQLQQILRSDATLTHTFPEGKNSVTANLHHEQNLTNNSVTQNLPQVTFRRGQSAFFPAPKATPGDTTKPEPRWYNSIYYSYTGEALRRRAASHPDTAQPDLQVSKSRSAARHSVNINSPQKVSYFSLTPGVNFTDTWVDEYLDYSNGSVPDTISGFKARHTFSTSLGLTSKVYGYWVNPLPGVDAIRHVATPTVSVSYIPDFRDRQWGYYQYAQDSLGVTQRYDRFAGSLYGGTPAGKTFGLNFQLSNLFQMKYGGNPTTTDSAAAAKEKKKVDLFTMDFSTSYNFAADSLRFAPLHSSFRASPLSNAQNLGPLKSLSFDITSTHNFYKYGSLGAINQYYFDPANGKILRLTNFDVSTSADLSIGTLVHPPSVMRQGIDSTYAGVPLAPDTAAASEAVAKSNQPPQWYLGQVPFDLRLSFHYTLSRANPSDPTDNYWLNASINTSITPNWQVSYSTYIDLKLHKVTTGTLSIYRDMHCWEASFNWSPVGIGQGYYLRINIKSPQLQDVKVERKRDAGSFGGFGY